MKISELQKNAKMKLCSSHIYIFFYYVIFLSSASIFLQ
jgi:hypothetical protein